jgi:hypothetical protein
MALARQPRWEAGGIRVLSEEAIVPMPSHLSFEEASTLAMRRGDCLG